MKRLNRNCHLVDVVIDVGASVIARKEDSFVYDRHILIGDKNNINSHANRGTLNDSSEFNAETVEQ